MLRARGTTETARLKVQASLLDASLPAAVPGVGNAGLLLDVPNGTFRSA